MPDESPGALGRDPRAGAAAPAPSARRAKAEKTETYVVTPVLFVQPYRLHLGRKHFRALFAPPSAKRPHGEHTDHNCDAEEDEE